MLERLVVRNLALIEETEVEFAPGLNILTGETGAGKSLLIGSVSLALGGKFDPAMLRTGAETAYVELAFSGEGELAAEKLRELDLEPEEDGSVILSRRMAPGKSICKINGETVTAKQVRELAEVLIDIHGQHEHETLLRRAKHLEILDAYCGEELSDPKSEAREAFFAWREKKEKLEGEARDTGSLAREQSLAEFELREIEEARLVPGEDEALERDYRRMGNAQRIAEGLGAALAATGSDSAEGASAQLSHALRALRGIAQYDERLGDLEEQLSQVDSLLADYNRDAAEYLSGMEFDEQSFRETESRLNLVNRLKEKYGGSVERVLAYAEEKRAELEKYADYDLYLERLEQEAQRARERLDAACAKVTKIRKKCAKAFAKELKAHLEELNFLEVAFEVRLEACEPNAQGADSAEFLISTNPGESVKPLQTIASGGELSRVMLGVKTVLAGRDHTGTLIFDEIDAGISGRTAWKVAGQLAKAGADHQVLCITHLAQIAAMADAHFVIEKSADAGSTITDIRRLDADGSLAELARLLGSDEITESALENARELRRQAEEAKGR